MNIKEIDIKHFKGLTSVHLDDLSRMNALIGKNNSGKSSVLHAIDIACLALSIRNWNRFQPKLEIKDLITDVGNFNINITYNDNSTISIFSTPEFGPNFSIQPNEKQKLKSILIFPDVGMGLTNRRHKTPNSVIQQINNKNFGEINSLDILYSIRFFSERGERGLSKESYNSIISEIANFFPEIKSLHSDRTGDDIATLTYEEYGNKLDILYSGTGLKHILDVLVKTILSGANIVLIDEPELGLHPDLQRKFFEYLTNFAEQKDLQIFIGTHSHVIMNYADDINFYRIINKGGVRGVVKVESDSIHTMLSDLGIRPSDVFNKDICILVEGPTDVIFFEHIIGEIYKENFKDVSVGIIQYGGSSADGIISDEIDISNIVSSQKYLLWIRDRDSKPTDEPSRSSNRFKNKIESNGFICHIWNNREIEYYFPENLLIEAQDGDLSKIQKVKEIITGDQGEKFRDQASKYGICVPKGKNLRNLLRKHITSKDDIKKEIRDIIEKHLLTWKEEII